MLCIDLYFDVAAGGDRAVDYGEQVHRRLDWVVKDEKPNIRQYYKALDPLVA